MPWTRLPVKERLQRKIAQINGCWVWQGSVMSNGYGNSYKYVGDKQVSAPVHRIAYEAFVGEIPKGLQIDHLCRNRLCVNPEHLEAVTPAENRQRASKLNRADIAQIKTLRLEGWKQYQIGKMFGIHPCQVSRILNNKRWRTI